MKIYELIKRSSSPQRLFRFFCYKFPLTIRNFVLGFLNTKLKKYQCNICGCNKVEFVYAMWANFFLRCPKCNIYFAANLLSIENIRQEFLITDNKEYWLKRGRYVVSSESSENDWESWVDWKIHTFKRFNLEEFEKNITGSRKALEIGCAEGKVLGILKKRGWKVIGLDISEYEAQLCQKSNFNVIVATAERQNFRDEYFNLVVMFHTLEHTVNPMFVIRNIFNVLEKGGRFLLEVPYLEKKRDFFADFFNFSHLYFFSKEGMEKLLMANGFYYVDNFIYDDQLHMPKRNICYLFEKR